MYIAKTWLFHRPTQADVEPGQAVDLSHLSKIEIDDLLSKGYVAEVKAETEAAIYEPFADDAEAGVTDVPASDAHKKARAKKTGG